jgi:hypothetical protein
MRLRQSLFPGMTAIIAVAEFLRGHQVYPASENGRSARMPKCLAKILVVACALALPGWAYGAAGVSRDVEISVGAEVGQVLVLKGNATIVGRVKHNVWVISGNALVRDSAYIGGDVVCVGGKIELEPGAVVLGSRVELNGEFSLRALPFQTILHWLYRLMWIMIIVACGLLVFALAVARWMPDWVIALAESIDHDLAWNLIAGILGISVILPLTLGLGLSVLGLPIALLFACALGIGICLGLVAMGCLIGYKITNRYRLLPSTLLGVCVIIGIFFIPLVGIFLTFILSLPGLGALLLKTLGLNRQVSLQTDTPSQPPANPAAPSEE